MVSIQGLESSPPYSPIVELMAWFKVQPMYWELRSEVGYNSGMDQLPAHFKCHTFEDCTSYKGPGVLKLRHAVTESMSIRKDICESFELKIVVGTKIIGC